MSNQSKQRQAYPIKLADEQPFETGVLVDCGTHSELHESFDAAKKHYDNRPPIAPAKTVRTTYHEEINLTVTEKPRGAIKYQEVVIS